MSGTFKDEFDAFKKSNGELKKYVEDKITSKVLLQMEM